MPGNKPEKKNVSRQNKMDWKKCKNMNNKKPCTNPAHKEHRHHWLGGWYWSNGKPNQWTLPE